MTELEQLREELTAAHLVIEQMREALREGLRNPAGDYTEDIMGEALALQPSTEALAAFLRKRDAALLRELAGNCLPNVRRYDSTVSVQKTLHNIAVADCVKHVFYLAAKRESGEWEPDLKY